MTRRGPHRWEACWVLLILLYSFQQKNQPLLWYCQLFHWFSSFRKRLGRPGPFAIRFASCSCPAFAGYQNFEKCWTQCSIIFSIKIQYPLVGSLTSTWVTAPTSLPSWVIGLPLTSDYHYGQHYIQNLRVSLLYPLTLSRYRDIL